MLTHPPLHLRPKCQAMLCSVVLIVFGGVTSTAQAQQPLPSPDKIQTPTPAPLPPLRSKPGFYCDDHDTDGFKMFDALSRPRQRTSLKHGGPRLPREYYVSDFSIRAFFKGGAPFLIDYGLDSDEPAELSISVGGGDPLVRKLDPVTRGQLQIALPASFGAEWQVGKLHITALTKSKGQADFYLFGLGVGDRAVAALRKQKKRDAGLQLALSSAPMAAGGYEPLPLFPPRAPRTTTSILIKVDPPRAVDVRKGPKAVAFRLHAHDDFSNGRWEMWLVGGLQNWYKVWQDTIGSITDGQTKSKTWNGKQEGFRGKVSVGKHLVQINAWQANGADRGWVLSRGEKEDMIVVK